MRKQFGQFVRTTGKLPNEFISDAVDAREARTEVFAIDTQPSKAHCPSFYVLRDKGSRHRYFRKRCCFIPWIGV